MRNMRTSSNFFKLFLMQFNTMHIHKVFCIIYNCMIETVTNYCLWILASVSRIFEIFEILNAMNINCNILRFFSSSSTDLPQPLLTHQVASRHSTIDIPEIRLRIFSRNWKQMMKSTKTSLPRLGMSTEV